MRKTILAAVAAAADAGAAAGGMIHLAAAQQPAPDQRMPTTGIEQGPGMTEGGTDWHPGAGHWHWMQRMHWMMHGMHHGPFAPGTFALFDRDADRHLSAADVEKIAQAFLLWHGNHTWQVGDVVENPDTVGFAYTAPDGTVIAKFTMDRRTGRITRTG